MKLWKLVLKWTKFLKLQIFDIRGKKEEQKITNPHPVSPVKDFSPSMCILCGAGF